MHMRHLRYFVVAAEEENFNRAAERLNLAQPALSRRIRGLENELGIELFERRQKRVHLSTAGKAFFEDAQQILLDVERAAARVRRIARREGGILSIGVNDSALRHDIIAKALRDFHTNFAEVEMRIGPTAPAPLLEAVLSGSVDAAFIYTRPPDSLELSFTEVADDHFVLALPAEHPAARKPRISLSDLKGEEFLWLPRESAPQIYDRLMDACAAGGLVPRLGQSILSESSRLHLVAEGMGLTFVTSAFEGFLPESVITRHVDDFSVALTLELVWRHDNTSPALHDFRKTLHQVASRSGRGSSGPRETIGGGITGLSGCEPRDQLRDFETKADQVARHSGAERRRADDTAQRSAR